MTVRIPDVAKVDVVRVMRECCPPEAFSRLSSGQKPPSATAQPVKYGCRSVKSPLERVHPPFPPMVDRGLFGMSYAYAIFILTIVLVGFGR